MNRSALFLTCLLAAGAAGAQTVSTAPPEASTAPAQPAWFVDVSSPAGLAGASMQNAVWADVNGDGWLDCLAAGAKAGANEVRLFLNEEKDGRRAFRDITAESGVTAPPEGSTVPRVGSFHVFGDVDNDGDQDLFSGMYCEFEKPKAEPGSDKPLKDAAGNIVFEKRDDGLRSEILLNDGAGHFSRVKDSGVGSRAETAGSAAFLDYDKDGVLDLFVGNWYKEYGFSYISYPSRLYRGLGGGRFEEVTERAGLLTQPTEGKPDSSRPVYGVSHCDWNGDGWEDLAALAYGRQANRLWKNNGDGTFTDVGLQTGFDGDEIRHGRYPAGIKREAEQEWRSHGNTFSAACADYDNDGDMDFFTGEITHWWAGEASDRSALLENLGPEKGFAFRRHPDILNRVHVDTKNWNQGDMRVTWLDYDRDGRLDLLMSSGDYPDPNFLKLYRQAGPLAFEDVSGRAGFDWESSAGVSVGDYDGNGTPDILAGKSWMRMPAAKRRGAFPAGALFSNGAPGGSWLGLRLEGKGAGAANRGAVGARVTVKAGGVTQTREVQSVMGPSGQADALPLLLGLGEAAAIDSLEVRWPDKAGSVSRFTGVKVNTFAVIRQDQEGINYSAAPM